MGIYFLQFLPVLKLNHRFNDFFFIRGNLGFNNYSITNISNELNGNYSTKESLIPWTIGLNFGLSFKDHFKLGWIFQSSFPDDYTGPSISRISFASSGWWFEINPIRQIPLYIHAGIKIMQISLKLNRFSSVTSASSMTSYFKNDSIYSSTSFSAHVDMFDLGLLYHIKTMNNVSFNCYMNYHISFGQDNFWFISPGDESVNNIPGKPIDTFNGIEFGFSLDFGIDDLFKK